ncbi:MAG: sensor histidine kinase [Ruminococcus sp.]|jgi:signal transduction histidine kinase
MKEHSVGAFVIIQILGYMLQIIPILFLFYAPYKQEHLRFPKREMLWILCEVYVIASVAAGIYLGFLYIQGAGEAVIIRNANLIFAICLGGGSLIYFLSFRDGVQGRVLLYMLVIQYGILIYVFNTIAAKFFPQPLLHNIFPYSVGSLIAYVVVTGITYPFIYHFLRHRGVQELLQVNQRELRMITGCSVAILILMIAALQMEVNLDMQIFSKSGKISLSIWMLCFMAGDVLAYFIYFACLILEKEKQEMRSRLASYQQQYKWLNDRMEKEKKKRHNLRHHLRTMDTLAQEGQTEKLQAYIENYLTEVKEIELQQLSRNPVLDEVMSYYVVQAKEKQIQLKYRIEIKDNLVLNLMDMTVLLGNALENALNACGECEEGTACIQVMIRQFKKTILIKIENSLPPGDYEAKGTKIQMGYGLESIDLIARKYQGGMDTKREQNRFILRVILNISEEEEI